MRIGFSPSFTSNRINMNSKLGNQNQSTGFGNGKTELAVKTEKYINDLLKLNKDEKLTFKHYSKLEQNLPLKIHFQDVGAKESVEYITKLINEIGTATEKVKNKLNEFLKELM